MARRGLRVLYGMSSHEMAMNLQPYCYTPALDRLMTIDTHFPGSSRFIAALRLTMPFIFQRFADDVEIDRLRLLLLCRRGR